MVHGAATPDFVLSSRMGHETMRMSIEPSTPVPLDVYGGVGDHSAPVRRKPSPIHCCHQFGRSCHTPMSCVLTRVLAIHLVNKPSRTFETHRISQHPLCRHQGCRPRSFSFLVGQKSPHAPHCRASAIFSTTLSSEQRRGHRRRYPDYCDKSGKISFKVLPKKRNERLLFRTLSREDNQPR